MSEGIEFEGNVIGTNTKTDFPTYANEDDDKPKPASVCYQWLKRPSGVAAVCLGLLCVLLLARIIGLSVHYGVIGHQYFTEKDKLQTSYNNLKKERDQLQTSYNNLTKERDELQTRCKPLSEERDQLQTSNNNLTKERDGNSQMLSVKCPYELKEFGNSSYFISTTKNNWENANQDCRNRGTKLVIINNQEEQKFLISLNINTWIGLSDIETEGTWRWVDGTPLTTAYWGPQQPDNGGDPEVEEDCVEIVNWNRDPVKMWSDMRCNTERNWICEAVID